MLHECTIVEAYERLSSNATRQLSESTVQCPVMCARAELLSSVDGQWQVLRLAKRAHTAEAGDELVFRTVQGLSGIERTGVLVARDQGRCCPTSPERECWIRCTSLKEGRRARTPNWHSPWQRLVRFCDGHDSHFATRSDAGDCQVCCSSAKGQALV